MARVEVTTRALADLERLFDFLAEHNPQLARERIISVRQAFELPFDISWKQVAKTTRLAVGGGGKI